MSEQSWCRRRINCQEDVHHTHQLLGEPPWLGPTKIHVPLWMEREIRTLLTEASAPQPTPPGAAQEDGAS